MFKRISDKFQTWLSQQRIARTAGAVAQRSNPSSDSRPVVFFNASARLGHLSQNAAFSLLAAWGLRLADLRVVHFVCERGMSRCVLGTNPDDPGQPPPCAACVGQSKRLYARAEVQWFNYSEETELNKQVAVLDVPAMERFVYQGEALGEVVTPSLRWTLRRHHLVDDEATRFLFREYILSAYSVGREFEKFLDRINPQAVVLFNGIMYPEAIARRLAQRRGARVITHEVGLRPFSAFFTDGQATAYPMEIPADFQLSEEQDKLLDEYLGERFQGQFTMAGIRFWPKMQELDERFLQKTTDFKRIVPVFTNVIFDTSQVHANTIFSDMFAWLDEVLGLIKAHADTLFVIRAHPDEMRPGTRKKSRETVRQWVIDSKINDLTNVIFVDSDEYLSSYALIQRAHFVMVYNSSIGLEASIMSKPVLAAGAGRYTQYQTVYFPASADGYLQKAKDFLNADTVDQPVEFVQEARRVLYFQLFRTALPFEDYLTSHNRMGYVHVNDFTVESLTPENSVAIRAIYDGVVNGKPFLV
ncbi:MAG: hypothetical protein WEC37_02170 [Anaerolineales bacterium]